MTNTATSDLWWKNTIVYGLDVKTFLDSDGDGVGDLEGLTRRLDYLRDLGVSCLWLTPFYPSPMRDDGYDISDYYAVHPRLGTLGDFVEMTRTAHAMGIRVLVDLVLNHTSDEHPWFRERPAYYIWADRPQPDPHGIVFPGEQTETWTYDERAGAYYFHRYHDFQPDLATDNPDVRDEMHKIMGFWLELGVDGFRVDSLPFLIKKSGVLPSVADTHEYLRDLRGFLSRRRGSAVLLGEANVPQEAQRAFFGDPRCPHDSSEAHLLFDFATQAGIWLALARQQAQPVARALRGRPAIPQSCQYAVFARHHDELTMEQVLSDAERDEVWAAFAPDEEARIYGRGIRRRLAPLLSADPRRIRFTLSLVMALPGTPILLYGDEIGLGDDLRLPGRLAVRTPMQWSDLPAGGFSTAPAERLVRPVHADGRYGYRSVNVAAQRGDPGSQLAFVNRLIGARRDCPEIGWGDWEILETGDPRVLALRMQWQGGQVLTVHNFGADPAQARLAIADDTDRGQPREVLADSDYPAPAVPGAPLSINGYGYRWLRLVHQAETATW